MIVRDGTQGFTETQTAETEGGRERGRRRCGSGCTFYIRVTSRHVHVSSRDGERAERDALGTSLECDQQTERAAPAAGPALFSCIFLVLPTGSVGTVPVPGPVQLSVPGPGPVQLFYLCTAEQQRAVASTDYRVRAVCTVPGRAGPGGGGGDSFAFCFLGRQRERALPLLPWSSRRYRCPSTPDSRLRTV